MPEQPKQLSMQTLLDVIKALKIDVPIMRIEEDVNGAVTVYLYGGEVKHWPPAATAVVGVDGIHPDGVHPEAQPRIDPPPPVLERHQEPPPPPPYVKKLDAGTPPKKTRSKKVKP